MNAQLDIFNQDLAGLYEEEKAVCRAIKDHRGRENAIRSKRA